jgi:hypothetical protein
MANYEYTLGNTHSIMCGSFVSSTWSVNIHGIDISIGNLNIRYHMIITITKYSDLKHNKHLLSSNTNVLKISLIQLEIRNNNEKQI